MSGGPEPTRLPLSDTEPELNATPRPSRSTRTPLGEMSLMSKLMTNPVRSMLSTLVATAASRASPNRSVLVSTPTRPSVSRPKLFCTGNHLIGGASSAARTGTSPAFPSGRPPRRGRRNCDGVSTKYSSASPATMRKAS